MRRRTLSYLIVPLCFIACRDIPQAPRAKTESDTRMAIDSANAAAADSARLSAAQAKASKSVGASNTPAVISNVSFPDHALVGEPVTLSFSFTDDAEDSPWFVSVDWSNDDGLGRQVDSFANPLSFSFAYPAAGQYTMVLHVYDNFGADAFITKDISITETAVNTPAGSNVRVTPAATPSGTPATMTYTNVSTAGNTQVAVSSFAPPRIPNVRFGSTTSMYDISTSAAFSGTVQVCITYDPTQYPRPGRARLLHDTRSGWEDITTTFDATTHTVCGETMSFSNFIVGLANEAPTAALVLPTNVNEAATAAFSVNASDVDNDQLEYVWSFGDGSASVTTGTPSVSHVYGDNGSFNVSVVARDFEGLESAPSTSALTVANVAPSATFSAPASVKEGSSVSLSFSDPTDPSAPDQTAGFSYAFDCGSGFGVFSPSPSGSCVLDNGMRAVHGKVRDKDLGERAYDATVEVVNLSPTIGPLSGPTKKVHRGDAVNVTANVSDPGANDVFTATIDWGDGSIEKCAVSGNVVDKSHVYSAAGDFTVSVYVTDKDGGRSATVQTAVSVVGGPKTDPGTYLAKNVVIGAGSFLDASVTSAMPQREKEKHRVQFAVFARGGDIRGVGPDARFEVRSAKMSFKALTFDRLSVDGAQASLSGSGRIERDGARYAYLVSAVDGDRRHERQRDFVRVRIWNATSGRVVFDNQPGAGDNAAPQSRVADGGIEVRDR